MGFLNNPLPSSMASECKKCASILTSFVDPRQAFGPDKIIPPEILANAKGLAILTVLKAGFIGSGRFGSGIIVARKPDGTWSAPSAIGTVGGGVGGQIGFELTDFVFILNDSNAVRSFAQAGSITLGGNVSIAAGPVGRNAEAAGTASLKAVSGIFSYSKTKGLFAGVSLEGSAIIERKDANEKMYGRRVTARACLGGEVPVPPGADALMAVLNSRVFAGRAAAASGGDVYNDVPVYGDDHDDVVWQGRQGNAYGEGVRTDRTGSLAGTDNDYVYQDRPQRAATWNDNTARSPASPRVNNNSRFDRLEAARGQSSYADQSDYSYSDRKTAPPPARPTAAKPVLKQKSAGPGQAIAKFAFEADQPGDLGFKKGEVITIVKKTEKQDDWWTGRIDGREGVFPANYVEVV